jgi:hypothetical protein
MTYDEALARMQPETVRLFSEMVEAHLQAGGGHRVFIVFGSMRGDGLIFSGNGRQALGGHVRQSWEDVDTGGLMDLAGFGLLHIEYNRSGDACYRISEARVH